MKEMIKCGNIYMKSDCSKCSGLCCTALYFSKMNGFPKDKVSGQPCTNLLKDYRCKIHSQLEKQKTKGCIEAMSLISAQPLAKSIQCLIEENIKMCHYRPTNFLSIDLEQYRNRFLRQTFCCSKCPNNPCTQADFFAL